MLKGLFFLLSASIFFTLLVWSALRAHEQGYTKRDTTSYHVLILPICNPGFRCDPDIPRQLEYLFFRHEQGVAAYIKNVSGGQTRIVGHAADWMRTSHKHKSAQHVLEHRDEIVRLGTANAPHDRYDMVFLYTMMSGPATEKSFTRSQLDVDETQGLHPGLAIMINAPVFNKSSSKHPKSAILPSTSWATELLHATGLHDRPWHVNCAQKTGAALCMTEQSPSKGL